MLIVLCFFYIIKKIIIHEVLVSLLPDLDSLDLATITVIWLLVNREASWSFKPGVQGNGI